MMGQAEIVKAFIDCGNVYMSARQLAVIILNVDDKGQISHVTRALRKMIKHNEVEV